MSPQSYFIFGHNIAHSLSPTLHNAGFRELGLPHHYSIHESEAVDDTVEAIMKRPDFAGASVTYPHKLQIGRLLDSQTPAAEKVGAVNTVVARHVPSPLGGTGTTRHLEGGNTDWLGIKRCVLKNSGTRRFEECSGLVLGAGGAARAACYALQMIGVARLVIVNRTLSKGEEMASHFPEIPSVVLGSLEEAAVICDGNLPLGVIVACVPADDLGEEVIPEALFAQVDEGVLVEMAYRPQVTGMMKVAQRRPGWKISRGVDVLEEQAFEQFELWTGKPAPVEVMREAVSVKLGGKL